MQWTEHLRNGATVRIRPIEANDARREQDFLEHLPPEQRAYRFLGLIKSANEHVARALANDNPADEITLIGLIEDGDTEIEIAAARYRVHGDGTRCDCAVTVAPDWQQRGVGRILMQHLIDVARLSGIRHMYAVDATRCAGAHLLAEHLGFQSRPDPEDPAVTTFELTVQ
jgi:GNAT superfamily N-acetyltransferase